MSPGLLIGRSRDRNSTVSYIDQQFDAQTDTNQAPDTIANP
ncbi:hypothetical protein [Microcoleus sp. herbarium12]